MYDLFISYSSIDRDEVRLIVDAFAASGLNVWWDQLIPDDAEWSPAIEKALDASQRVVAFISRNVAESDRYYVVAEIKRAHEQHKLVPVKVGEFNIPLSIDGYVFGRQMFLVRDFENFRTGPSLNKVCRLLHPQFQEQPRTETVADWFAANPPLSQIALAIAVAVAESAQLSVVTEMAQRLENKLKTLAGETEAAPSAANGLFQSRTRNLEGVRAVQYNETHPRLLIDIDCVRFRDTQWAAQVLAYVWNEFDSIRGTFVDWLDHYAHTGNLDLRLRIGLTIGTLARSHLSSVLEQVLYRWMHDEHPAARDIADIALSFVVFESTQQHAITEIVRELAGSGNTTKLRAAIELACGYTGSRLEGLSIEVLKRVAKNAGKFGVVECINDALDFMMSANLQSGDTTLFDLRKLVDELADWVETAPKDERLPMALFLGLMSRLPLRGPDNAAGALSLEALMATQRPGSSGSKLDTTARIFEAALRDFGSGETGPRKTAEKVLRLWQDSPQWSAEGDPLIELARLIYKACPNDHDRSRLLYAMRKRYRPEQIASPIPILDAVAAGPAAHPPG